MKLGNLETCKTFFVADYVLITTCGTIKEYNETRGNHGKEILVKIVAYIIVVFNNSKLLLTRRLSFRNVPPMTSFHLCNLWCCVKRKATQ